MYRIQVAMLLCALFCAPLRAGERIPENAVWIDVRSPQEYARGHLEGASLVPFDGIEAGVTRLGLDRNTPIYLYCAVGGRAEVARQRLEAIDYSNVTNVGGLADARRLAGVSTERAAAQ
jgi:phage shock protein E